MKQKKKYFFFLILFVLMSHILNKFKLAPIPEIVNQYNISEENPFIKENDCI